MMWSRSGSGSGRTSSSSNGQNKLDDSMLETIKAHLALLSCCCCWVVALRSNKFVVALANSRQL
eukprot:3700415-Ditylum_brightwellii.AAC.1